MVAFLHITYFNIMLTNNIVSFEQPDLGLESTKSYHASKYLRFAIKPSN